MKWLVSLIQVPWVGSSMSGGTGRAVMGRGLEDVKEASTDGPLHVDGGADRSRQPERLPGHLGHVGGPQHGLGPALSDRRCAGPLGPLLGVDLTGHQAVRQAPYGADQHLVVAGHGVGGEGHAGRVGLVLPRPRCIWSVFDDPRRADGDDPQDGDGLLQLVADVGGQDVGGRPVAQGGGQLDGNDEGGRHAVPGSAQPGQRGGLVAHGGRVSGDLVVQGREVAGGQGRRGGGGHQSLLGSGRRDWAGGGQGQRVR